MLFANDDEPRNSRPRLRLGLAGAVAALLAGGALGGSIAADVSAGTGQSPRVTLRAHPTIVGNANPTLSGEIDRPVAGEIVDIQAKDCGSQFFRGVTGTTTIGGGKWTVHWWGPFISTTIRAVWDGNASAPVTIWKRASVSLVKVSGGRLRAGAWGGGGAAFWHRRVQIQQRRGGAWKTVKTVVLTERSGTVAYFRPRGPRGTLLRAVLPASQAKPCFLGGVSPTLRT